MRTVNINLGDRSYDIRIAPKIFAAEDELLPWIDGKQVIVITNEVVAPLYLQQLKTALHSKQVYDLVLADGEETKTLDTAGSIFDRMLEIPLDRKATVIALGGGVIGDMAGFSAACYQRGIPFIQIPTTLLAQVDSSVGGKTAVNHARGKNMIGAFYQPKRVLADTAVLSTLAPRQFSSGLAEVIKYGLISDRGFFDWLEQNMPSILNQDSDALSHVVEQSCLNKARLVEADERESGIRALLNLGHTFGHAVETAVGYGNWLHGEAVSIGMLMASSMSCEQGWMSMEAFTRTRNLLKLARLPVEPSEDFSVQELKRLMKLDKKVSDGQIHLVLLKGIGDAFVSDNYAEKAFDSTLEKFALG